MSRTFDRTSTRYRFHAAVIPLIAIGMLAACSGGGEDPGDGGDDVGDVLGYTGSDREEFLYAGAQEEGELILYTAHTAWESIEKAFEEDYPDIDLKVQFDVESAGVRIQEETRAGLQKFDVYEDVLGKFPRTEEFFSAWETPKSDGIDERLVDPYFKGTRGFMISVAYNPNLIAEADLPNDWEDLADEEWRGLIGMGAIGPEVHMVGLLLETFGDDYIEALAENTQVQDVSTRAIADQIAAGEIPLTISGLSSHAYQAAATDAPMVWLPMDPMVASWGAVSIAKEPLHPYAAALFSDWLLSEDGGREVYTDLGNSIPLDDGRLVPLSYIDADTDLHWIDLTLEYTDYPKRYVEWEQTLRTVFIQGKQ